MREFGAIDILVNSSGIPHRRPALELPAEDWHRVLDINLRATFLCYQAAGRIMAAKGRVPPSVFHPLRASSEWAEERTPTVSARVEFTR